MRRSEPLPRRGEAGRGLRAGRELLLLLFFLSSLLSASAQSLAERLDSLLRAHDALTQRILVGISVYDLTADTFLYRHNDRQTMRPASNMKVVTAIAALDRLGADYRYTTTFTLDTTRLDSLGVLSDRLFIRAGMDPLLGRSDLDRIAQEISRLGVREIAGGLCFDHSIKETARWGEGWCWDDDEDTNPTLSAFLFNGKPTFEDNLLLALARQDIRVTSPPSQSTSPERANVRLTVERPVAEVLRPMMKRSDNLMAESLFYQLAHAVGGDYADRRSAADTISRLVRSIGLEPSDYYFADGSGVSLYNYASPELLLGLLRYAWQHEDIYRTLLPSLPRAGEDGTLQNRMTGSRAVGNVQAKTGTVTGASTLSGYATASNGHRLCFSIMCQGQRSARTARDLQDRICLELVR